MGTKVFKANLSASSIEKLIQDLETYSRTLDDKAQRLRELIGERIAWSASEGFSSALTSDVFTGAEPPASDVQVTVTEEGNVTVVIASGEDAVFIEFGAGVFYNSSVGTSPHPYGEQNGFTIGEYGKGQGKRNVWALPGSTKDAPILTHGTPAAMPMYHGVQDALAVIVDLAKEVFM